MGRKEVEYPKLILGFYRSLASSHWMGNIIQTHHAELLQVDTDPQNKMFECNSALVMTRAANIFSSPYGLQSWGLKNQAQSLLGLQP